MFNTERFFRNFAYIGGVCSQTERFLFVEHGQSFDAKMIIIALTMNDNLFSIRPEEAHESIFYHTLQVAPRGAYFAVNRGIRRTSCLG